MDEMLRAWEQRRELRFVNGSWHERERYGAAAYLSVLTVWFLELDKSNASSFASTAVRPRFEKLMSVCSGRMPQREVICGISATTDRMASAPSPSEFLSRLRWGKVRCQGALT